METLPWWIYLVIIGIVLSGYMVLYTSKKEQEMDNDFIEKEGEVYMKRLEEDERNGIRIVIRIRYCFNRNFERLPTRRTLYLGGSLFFLEEQSYISLILHVYDIHHELLLMVFIYIFTHKNGTSAVFTGGD